MRFGKFLVRINYPGQPSKCHKCHLYDHETKNCPNTVCYNCDDVGHTCKECPVPEKCLICPEEDHRAFHCPFSWRNRTPPDDHDDDDAPVDFPPPRSTPDDVPLCLLPSPSQFSISPRHNSSSQARVASISDSTLAATVSDVEVAVAVDVPVVGVPVPDVADPVCASPVLLSTADVASHL